VNGVSSHPRQCRRSHSRKGQDRQHDARVAREPVPDLVAPQRR
jgi:hypothetical protein